MTKYELHDIIVKWAMRGFFTGYVAGGIGSLLCAYMVGWIK